MQGAHPSAIAAGQSNISTAPIAQRLSSPSVGWPVGSMVCTFTLAHRKQQQQQLPAAIKPVADSRSKMCMTQAWSAHPSVAQHACAAQHHRTANHCCAAAAAAAAAAWTLGLRGDFCQFLKASSLYWLLRRPGFSSRSRATCIAAKQPGYQVEANDDHHNTLLTLYFYSTVTAHPGLSRHRPLRYPG